MIETVQKLLTHITGHPGEYLMLLVIVFGLGWGGSSAADLWMNGRIKMVVSAETQPLQQKIASVQTDVSGIKGTLDDLLARSLQREILEIRTLLCYSPGDRRLLDSYEDTQNKYFRLTGRKYEPPDCTILRKPQ